MPDSQLPTICLLFDSRGLFFIFLRPAWHQTDSVAREAVSLLKSPAEDYDVSVVWVSRHAGIEENEAADFAATSARDRAIVSFLDQCVANSVAAEWDDI